MIPEQRNGAQQRHEAEGLVEHEQEEGDADDAQRCGQQHHQYRDTLCNWIIRMVITASTNRWQAGHDRAGTLGRLLDRTADGDPVAGRQLLLDFVDGGLQLADDGRRLRVAVEVGADGDGRQAIAAPDAPVRTLRASVATCDSGTLLPLRVGSDRSASEARRVRSASSPRRPRRCSSRPRDNWSPPGR